MEIGITAFRAELRRWLNEAKSGEELIITDRGVAVARLTGVDSAPILRRLEKDGLLRLPKTVGRPRASGRSRATAERSVSELVSEQRD